MQFFKISFGLFVLITIGRLIPHPPNFSNMLALSFYVPALLGVRYIPILIISFIFTDFILGYHFSSHWTWGSILLISFFSKYMCKNLFTRLIGVIFGATVFYFLTNFGVWVDGHEGNIVHDISTIYKVALPFYFNSLISTFLFSIFIEVIYFFYKKNKFGIKINSN